MITTNGQVLVGVKIGFFFFLILIMSLLFLGSGKKRTQLVSEGAIYPFGDRYGTFLIGPSGSEGGEVFSTKLLVKATTN
jgi:hypothetical protein